MEDEQLIKFPSIRKIAEHIQINKLFHKTENQSSWSGDLKDDSEVILPKASFLLHLIVGSVRRFFTLYFKIEAMGTNNIPEGPCFFAPNHETELDAFLVLSYLDKKTLKDTSPMPKRTMPKPGSAGILPAITM